MATEVILLARGSFIDVSAGKKNSVHCMFQARKTCESTD